MIIYFENLRLCLVIVFTFYFQKIVFGNIKKKQFSYIFEINLLNSLNEINSLN